MLRREEGGGGDEVGEEEEGGNAEEGAFPVDEGGHLQSRSRSISQLKSGIVAVV